MWFVPVIVWMVIIFSYSAKTGSESSQQSGYVSGGIISTISKVLNLNWSEETTARVDYYVEVGVRKTAHFMEYLILTVLAYLPLRNVLLLKRFYKYYYAELFTIVYAFSDEVHQLFVEGRYGSAFDVLLDSLGGLMGCFLIYLVERKRLKKVSTHDDKHIIE